MTTRRRKGPVELAVTRQLAGLAAEARSSPLAAMALKMAVAFDAYEGADLAKLARLNQELRQTLHVLTEAGRDDGNSGEDEGLSTPVWDESAAVRDTAFAGASDAGAEGYADRPAAG